jgi:hypothetical protein
MTRTVRWPVFEVIRFALFRDLRGIGGVLRKKWFIFIMCLWASQASAQGTYTAATCNLSDVQAAITSEQARPVDGDIVSIPSGNCTWLSTLTQKFNNSVTIQGAGATYSTAGGASTAGSDVTTITLNGAGPTMDLTTVAGKSFRITGIAFVTSVASNTLLTVEGASTALRVDHCHFRVTNIALWVSGSMLGVADHLWFESPGSNVDTPMAFHNGIGWNGSTEGGTSNAKGDHSWADTDHFGTGQFFFVEDSRWTGGDIGDGSDAARYVLRHNTIVSPSGQMYNHGTTGSRGRGIRAAEVYHNNYNRTAQASNPSHSINSGALLYWGNTSTNYRYMVEMDYTRKDNSTYGYGTPPNDWGNCDGVTVRQVWDGPSPGYPCMDQPARGRGDLLANDFPNVVNVTQGNIPASTRQDLSPIYVWANTFNDAGYSPEGVLDNSYSPLLTDNRDYYQQFGTYGEPGSFNGTKGIGQGLLSARPSTCTAGPGGNTPGVGYWATDTNALYVCNPTNTWTVYYTPYTYPHPLTQSSVGTVAAPTGLVATVQ